MLWQGFTRLWLAIFLLAGCSLASGDGNSTLAWKPYPGYESLSDVRLAYLDVPIDWNNPENSSTITLGVTKIAAQDPERRIGYLFYNPGGPGGLASQQLLGLYASTPYKVDKEIWDRFDLIGVDLRGTGFSDPIKCNGTHPFPSLFPDTETAAHLLLAGNRAFRESCIELTGTPLFDYMDTVSIVHDHEAVRKALGGETITYFGQSYGTQLGSQWAELYPSAFRAMLLDAVVAIGQPTIAGFVEGAASAEAILKYFLHWCGKQNVTTCPLAHQSETPEEQWNALLQKATATSPSEVATVAQVAVNALYSPAWPASAGTGFEYLAQSIYNASNGISPPKAVEPPGANSRYNLSADWALTPISCADRAHPDAVPTDWLYKKLITQTEAPLIQGYSPDALFALYCAGLPPPSRNPPHPIHIPECEGFPTIFMISNKYDPSTPMAGAVLLREQIGKHRARYFPRNGAGHTVYFQPDALDGEAWKAMNRYLMELELPAEGTVFQS